jgi:hypothetical protein
MPVLDNGYIQQLLSLLPACRLCGECGHKVVQDYCRTCDEFYRIHLPGCRMYEEKHFGHRLTLVPFVEDRSK